jgi:hypothetical protein
VPREIENDLQNRKHEGVTMTKLTKMALVLKPGEPPKKIRKALTLDEIKQIIGGQLEVLSLTGRATPYTRPWVQLFIDDEGWLKPNPQVNIEATKIAGQEIAGIAVATNYD